MGAWMVRRRQRRKQGDGHGSTGAAGTPGLKRVVAFGTLVVAVLAVSAYLLWPAVKPAGPATAGAVTVQVSMGGFSPSRIEARAGESVTLLLVNEDTRFHTDGGGWHQFAIDELGVDVIVAPKKTQEFTFTPRESGTFEFYCDVCCGGKENPYMQGTLAVTG